MALEIERQWLAPDDVELPDTIGPFRGEDIEQRTIVDTYLDTADLALRAGGGRLRLRTQNGRQLATFKRSLVGAADGIRRREEVEGPVEGDPERSDAFVAARSLSSAPLAPVGTLHTARAARMYRSGPLVGRGRRRPPALPRRQHGDARRGRGRRAVGRGVRARASPASSPASSLH